MKPMDIPMTQFISVDFMSDGESARGRIVVSEGVNKAAGGDIFGIIDCGDGMFCPESKIPVMDKRRWA